MGYTKIHFVKKARKDIWRKGVGGQPDEILIKKGESYYWYKFKYQDRVVSKTPPIKVDKYPFTATKEHQRICNKAEELITSEEYCYETYSELENYLEELEEKLENIPYNLQESELYQTIQERVEETQDYLEQIENLNE